MTMLKLLALLLSAMAIGADASPLASIHVKFVQPPHIQEHGITTDGRRLISQQSFLSIGRRNSRQNSRQVPSSSIDYYPRTSPRPRYVSPRNYASIEGNDIYFGTREYKQQTPDFSNGLAYADPLLLTGRQAMMAVKYIYGKGELFFKDIPHVRSILRNQEERRRNGLNGHILSSLRPNSPWYRRSE